MGQAPKIIDGIKRTRQQVIDDERQFTLNQGVLDPEPDPREVPEVRPQPVRVPRQTTD